MTHTHHPARRYPLPWPDAQHNTPLTSPQLLHPARSKGLHLTLTTSIYIEPQNTIDVARARASCFSAAELDAAMQLPTAAAEALAAGRGTSAHWQSLCSALNVAKAIESGGVVRGLAGHLGHIESALDAISERACTAEQLHTWAAPALWATEMDAVRLLVRLHAHQLKHLSYAEYQTAVRLAVARVLCGKGQIINEGALKGLES